MAAAMAHAVARGHIASLEELGISCVLAEAAGLLQQCPFVEHRAESGMHCVCDHSLVLLGFAPTACACDRAPRRCTIVCRTVCCLPVQL